MIGRNVDNRLVKGLDLTWVFVSTSVWSGAAWVSSGSPNGAG